MQSDVSRRRLILRIVNVSGSYDPEEGHATTAFFCTLGFIGIALPFSWLLPDALGPWGYLALFSFIFGVERFIDTSHLLKARCTVYQKPELESESEESQEFDGEVPVPSIGFIAATISPKLIFSSA